MKKLIGAIARRLEAHRRRKNRPFRKCRISVFGIKVPVRIHGLEEGVDLKISQALSSVFDIRTLPRARGKLRRLQLADLKLLKIFDLVCRKHDIPYYMSFGTLLGAVRHKGFIPWDDDLDLTVPAAYREKVQAVLEKELSGTNLMLWGVDKTRWDATLRISHRDFQFLNLDIFYDYSFSADVTPSWRERATAAYEKVHKKYVEEYKKMHKTESRERIREFRERIDAYYRELLPEMVDFDDPRAKSALLPLLAPLYRLVVPTSVIWPTRRIEFEGVMLNAPNEPEAYLRELYGDFLSFPLDFTRHQSAFRGFEEAELDRIEGDLDEVYRKIGG